ncbi:hypothetical protein FA13DRAFT_365354 [Coprinellus micaceus]|uniref:DUF6533 domain-containing protein n=1 Tax=Coprinellus micaceus TaxID=71717 RepID=A0A4Y7TB94_COPMI|nr:hypothetical protein FA13DRAFT_365354 [Coprinellus micaceus]
MDSATLATLIEIGHAQRNVIYVEVASMALVVAEIWNSLPEEVSLIWRAEWNSIKILFLLVRYFIFVDSGVVLYYTWSASTLKQCLRSFATGTTMMAVGVVVAEVILYLRVFALSGRSQWVGALLAILFVGFHGTTFVFVAKFVRSLQYAPSPVPTIIGCLLVNASSKDISIGFALIAASEIAILAITLWIIFAKYQRSKSRLVTLFSRDGLVYFALLTATSAGNIICNLAAPPGYSYLLVTPQRALHSILATRMVLHIRGVHGKTTHETSGSIPLSDIRYAVPGSGPVHTRSLQFPRESTFRGWPEPTDAKDGRVV